MKSAKRILCLAIAVIILAGLAACSGGGTSGGTSTSQSAQTSAAAAATTSASEAASSEPAEKTYDEKLKMSYATVQAREGYDYNVGDPFAAWWSEKFNYELEVAALGWDNWDERLRIWINSQDMPDFAVYNYTHADAAGFVEQDLLKKLPEDWKQRWPNVAAVYDKTTLGPKLDEIFGGTYFVTRSRFDKNLPGDPLPNHYSLYLRKDWAEKVGFPIKTTYSLTEVMDYLRLIKDQNPGGVTGLIPLTLTPPNAAHMFLQMNSTNYNTFYKDTDGQYKWGAAADDTLAGLQVYYEAFSTGLLDPEFFTLKSGEDQAKFDTTAVAGANFNQAPTAEVGNLRLTFTTNTKLNADDCFHLATVLGLDDHYHQRDLINYWGAIIFNPEVDDAKFERWMDVMDYTCTEEGYASTVMGLWGIDFEQNADGSYVSLLKEGEKLTGAPGESKYPSMGYILGSVKLWDDFMFDSPNIDKKYRDESKVLYSDRVKYGTPETFTAVDWDLFCYDSPSRRRASFDYATEFANIVTSATGAADLEQKWRAWIDSQNSIVQPVLDELNAIN